MRCIQTVINSLHPSVDPKTNQKQSYERRKDHSPGLRAVQERIAGRKEHKDEDTHRNRR